MRIIVFAERFECGAWTEWEHRCSDEEAAAVEASAKAKSHVRASANGVLFIDYLMAAEGTFNVSRGSLHMSAERDTRVYGIVVGELVFAKYERLKNHFELMTVV